MSVKQGGQSNQRTTRLVAATTESGQVVSVPVSLPLLGTTFNVITPDQLPHFKQMLCVDSNGFISGNVVSDVGVVIQQQQAQQQHQQPVGLIIIILNCKIMRCIQKYFDFQRSQRLR